MTPNAYSSLQTLQDAGQHFKTLRQAANKTQTEVASAVGMRQEALSRFEAGRATDFSLSKLMRLLQVLGHELEFKPTVRRPSLNELLGEVRHGTNSGPNAR